GALLGMPEYVDIIIPRGGKSLIERVSRDSQVPVIKHLEGNCHTFIDSDADLAKSAEVAFNAKTQRYGTCNTMETLLVDGAVAGDVLPDLGRRFGEAGVELRGC
ncbi:MAG: gamma-glutamyl-phosphate reductase, partial [Thiohalorhabdaceae bacterium]